MQLTHPGGFLFKLCITIFTSEITVLNSLKTIVF
jgi:hypothetical protein